MCVRVCPCMFVSVCAFVCVGVCAKVCMCFGGYGGKEKQDYAVMPSFMAAWYSRNVFHVYIMTINNFFIWKVLALVEQLCGKIVPVSLARFP